MKRVMQEQEEKPLASFGTDLAVRLVELFTFLGALMLAFQSSIYELFNAFGVVGQIGHVFIILALVMGVLYSLRRLNEVFLYRRAAKATGTYWRGQPRCPFLVVKNNFTCAITPENPMPLEEIGKCHVKNRWQVCWEKDKLPVMRSLLEDEEKRDPGLHARLAWQWGTMGPKFGTCDFLLNSLRIMQDELEKLQEEAPSTDEKTRVMMEKRWKNALSVGIWAAEQCRCDSESFVKEMMAIARKYSTTDDKIHQRILLYFNKGGRNGSSYLLEFTEQNLDQLHEDVLINFLYYIGYSQNEAAVPFLKNLILTHESEDVKVHASYMLVEMKKQSAIKALLTVFEKISDDNITRIVKDALKSVKHDSLHHLIMLLEDDTLVQESYDLLLEVLEKHIPDVEYKAHARWLLKKKGGVQKLREEIAILREHAFPDHVIHPLTVVLEAAGG